MANSTLRLTVDGSSVRLTLRSGRKREITATVSFVSPVLDTDPAETRWLLEDHPRLRSATADPIAERIGRRLSTLADDLRRAVFEPDPSARRIATVLADPTVVADLTVAIEEPGTGGWIPWELLLAPGSDHPLSVAAASFYRVSSTSDTSIDAARWGRLRVLLVTCRPDAENDVPFRSVGSRIVQAVAGDPDRAIEVDVLRPPTFAALGERLAAARAAGAPYDVVHFDGHGSYGPDFLDPSRNRGVLVFEDGEGGAEAVSGEMLGADLASHGVRWLLLNACRSAYTEPNVSSRDETGAPRAYGSLAAEVRAAGVPGVLAVGYNVYVVTAARLVADTYSALAAGRGLGEAVSHARKRLYQADMTRALRTFDWLVPVAFQADGAGVLERETVPSFEIKVSTTTPASAGLVDPGADGGPRSAERPFFGYDDVLLRLDRAATAGRPIEIVGLAGSGKSAVAGEFARWWAATAGERVVVLDFDALDSYDDFESALAQQLEQASEASANERSLVVLENVPSAEWTDDDRARFGQWVESRAAGSAPLLVTGRTSAALPEVDSVVLPGRDVEARVELAADVGFGPHQVRAPPRLLEWTQGVPSVIRLLPLIAHGLPLDQPRAVRKRLKELRSAKTDPPALGLALMEGAGLEFYDVRELRRVELPFALSLFQAVLSHHGWAMFTQFAKNKGWDLTMRAEPVSALVGELASAERAGLACRCGKGHLLHPLAPIALEPGLAGTLQALARGDPDRVRQFMGLSWGSYVSTVSVVLRFPVAWEGAPPRVRLRERENLWAALDLSLLGAWWGLALPLLHRLRDELVAEGREDEWETVLDDAFEQMRASPPDPDEMGPESAELNVIRLLASEAERKGRLDQLKVLRELQLSVARAADDVVGPVEPGKGRELDLGRIRLIAALLKHGDVARNQDSEECLVHYQEALRLAEEGDDVLRGGEAHLAIARAYFNVTSLRDPVRYEHHAREALKAGRSMGPFGKELVVDASISLGNAILEQVKSDDEPDADRLEEAREALETGATAEDATPGTRGTARNGLGNLLALVGDHAGAADQYLEACKEFEAAGQQRNLLMAETNGARALALAGRVHDAQMLAVAAVEGLKQDPAMVKHLLPVLRRVLGG